MKFNYKSENFFIGFFVCIFLALCIYIPVLSSVVYLSGASGDYVYHIKFAKALNDNQLAVPHILFHFITLLLHNFLNCYNISWETSAFIVVSSSEILTCIILYIFLNKEISCDCFDKTLMVIIGSVGLTILSPIYLLKPIDKFYYLGYIAPNVVHSPTYLVLKPIALLLFIMTKKILFDNLCSKKLLFLFSFLLFLSTIAKPSFIIIMIPSLVTLYLLFNNKVHTIYLLYSCLFCILCIALMFIFTYVQSNEYIASSSIKLMFSKPFLFSYHHSSENYFFVLVKLFFSFLFPIYIYVVFRDESNSYFYFNFALLLTLFSMFLYAFLIEAPARTFDGNFTWSALIANFLLFISAFVIFANNIGDTTRHIIVKYGSYIFFAHVICGLFYYLRLFQPPCEQADGSVRLRHL